MTALLLLCGVCAAVMAHRKRLDVPAAFVVGAIFGVLGIAAVAFAYPSVKPAAAPAILR